MNRIRLKRKIKLSKIKPINLIAIFIVAILVGIYFIFGYIKEYDYITFEREDDMIKRRVLKRKSLNQSKVHN